MLSLRRDEIQKAPSLLPAIKLAVDRRREAGRFLLETFVASELAKQLGWSREALSFGPDLWGAACQRSLAACRATGEEAAMSAATEARAAAPRRLATADRRQATMGFWGARPGSTGRNPSTTWPATSALGTHPDPT